MDEFALIARIRRRLGEPQGPITLGIGDDGAILDAGRGPLVLSVDVGVEGVHFVRAWLSFADIGFRTYAGALSDLAAMGATPTVGLLSLILPRDLGPEGTLAIVDGVAEAGRAFAAPVVGGNVSGGAELSLTLSVVGELGRASLRREGARVGDGIFVTGTVGSAALGWRLLEAGAEDDPRAGPFIARWRRPRPRFDRVAALVDVATAAIDISDGLAGDLGHVCRASGVGAEVEEAALPLHPDLVALAAAHGHDGVALALGGGEDYELLFTAPVAAVDPSTGTRIGTVVAGEPSVRVRGPSGAVREVIDGHRHDLG
ncbi:MAG: thiamine-phosphate kinase [Sandaracinaceae bacterium]